MADVTVAGDPGEVSPADPASWTSGTSGYVGINSGKTGTLAVSGGATLSSSAGDIGQNAGSLGDVTVTGTGSAWINSNALTVGDGGAGILRIDSSGCVSSGPGIVASRSGSTGTVTVAGPGSTWNTSVLNVGSGGHGSLTIANGGQVSSNRASVAGTSSSSAGTVTVTGIGSIWSDSGSIWVGLNSMFSPGIGVLSIANGAQVRAPSLSIGTSASVLNVRISGDNMLVLGTASLPGSIGNSGTINLYADSSLLSGAYRPVTDVNGRRLFWSGLGTCNAFGGVWDSVNRVFTVSDATPVAAGGIQSLAAGQRLSIASADGLRDVGASFGAMGNGSTFAASEMSSDELSTLAPSSGQSVLGAWDFATNLSAQTVLLSFDVGSDASNLQVWHLSSNAWTPYSATDLSYSNGIASFTVSSFSGYAVTGVVPEPTALGLLMLAACGLLRRRRHSEERS